MLTKTGIVLTGTAHDDHGKISVSAQVAGFVISKSDKYNAGNITLTHAELVAVLTAIESEWCHKSKNAITIPKLTEEQQATEAELRG